LYRALASDDDTGAPALIGLARLAASAGERGEAVAAYDRLDAEFGGRSNADGIGYSLIAEMGRAEVADDPEAMLSIYDRVVSRELDAPSAALEAIAAHAAAHLDNRELSPADQRRVSELAQTLERARASAGFASTFSGELDDVYQTAGEEPRGRPSLLRRDRTLVFRRLGDGGVVGLVVENRMLSAAAGRANQQVRAGLDHAQALVHRVGEPPDRARMRTMASASFGALLPHLTLSLVVDSSLPDPLDEIVEQRGKRHMALTGGLMLLLVIGLVATIRGAARERELARLKSEFVSTVSHELKTPLTSIRMFAEMLQQGVAGEDRKREARYQEIIVKESERLGLLIANLLDYSQIERGTRRYSRGDESLVDIAREALDTFGRIREGEQRRVEIDVEQGADEARVFVDREVVVQSALNLLSNAAKYGGDSPIRVVIAARDKQGVVSVIDQGPGIAATEHDKIFREFYRAPSAYKSQVEGTGLGLALVKRHIEAHGGRVELESAEGQGATFSIVLPRVESS
jgi:signal transduction histidine kinase